MIDAEHQGAVMHRLNTAVAICDSHAQAEQSLRAFQASGFDMMKLSFALLLAPSLSRRGFYSSSRARSLMGIQPG